MKAGIGITDNYRAMRRAIDVSSLYNARLQRGVFRHLSGADMINDEIMIAAALEIQATLETKLSDMSTPTIELSRAQAILATGMIRALVGLISDDESRGRLN